MANHRPQLPLTFLRPSLISREPVHQMQRTPTMSSLGHANRASRRSNPARIDIPDSTLAFDDFGTHEIEGSVIDVVSGSQG